MYVPRTAVAAAASVAAGCSAFAACDDTKKTASSSSSSTATTKKAEPKSVTELVANMATRHRQVFLSGSIDDDSAKAIVAQLLYLEADAPGVPVELLINSSGGKVYSGFAILNVMRALTSPVHTTCLGHCESMAAVLLAAGEPGMRCVLPHTRVMIHQPVRGASTGKSKAKDALIQASEIDKSRIKLCAVLAEATGLPYADIERLMDNDLYCDAAETCKLGLADRIGGKGHFTKPPAPLPAAATAVPSA